MIAQELSLDLSAHEFTIPCGCKGCDKTAVWMTRGEHSIFGCPGVGALCEQHRQETLHFLGSRAGETWKCKCGSPRTFSPAEFSFLAL